jgi:hypothetical protein
LWELRRARALACAGEARREECDGHRAHGAAISRRSDDGCDHNLRNWFQPGSIFFRRVDSLRNLNGLDKGRKIHRNRLSTEARWSYLTRASEKAPDGYVELGELCRVHRGQVTGANDVWIAGNHSADLPRSVLFRTVTRERELFDVEGLLDDASKLKCVIDIPIDLDHQYQRSDKLWPPAARSYLTETILLEFESS